MGKLIFLYILAIVPCTAQDKIPWTYLFNGKDLTGWAVLDNPANVKAADSSLVLHMTPYTSRHSFIRTTKRYKNFIFEVDFLRDLELDSGVLFRSIDAPDTAFSALFGYMVKIDPSQTRKWTGGVLLDYGNGLQWLYPLDSNAQARHAEYVRGAWNTLRIQCKGHEIKVWLNGIPTVHLMDDKYRKGYFAFKIHYLMAEKEKADLEIAYKAPRVITRKLKRFSDKMNLPIKDTRQKSEITYFR